MSLQGCEKIFTALLESMAGSLCVRGRLSQDPSVAAYKLPVESAAVR